MKCLGTKKIAAVTAAFIFGSAILGGCSAPSFDRAFDAAEATSVYEIGAGEKQAQIDTFAEGLIVIGPEDISVDSIDDNQFTSALLMCLDDEETLYSKEIFEQRFPASTTKLMTAYIILQNCDLDDTLTVSETAMNLEYGSSVAGLSVGDTITVRDCLYGLLLESGNDAANALAEYRSGTMDAFVEEMNETAASLGMTGTHYVNSSGLHDENHYTTAYDLYLILNAIRQNPTFMEIAGTASYTANYEHAGTPVTRIYSSTDYYLTQDHPVPEGITILGGKTGTTDQAGFCLALLTKSASGKTYFSIVLGAQTHESLYVAMDELLAAEK